MPPTVWSSEFPQQAGFGADAGRRVGVGVGHLVAERTRAWEVDLQQDSHGWFLPSGRLHQGVPAVGCLWANGCPLLVGLGRPVRWAGGRPPHPGMRTTRPRHQAPSPIECPNVPRHCPQAVPYVPANVRGSSTASTGIVRNVPDGADIDSSDGFRVAVHHDLGDIGGHRPDIA